MCAGLILIKVLFEFPDRDPICEYRSRCFAQFAQNVVM